MIIPMYIQDPLSQLHETTNSHNHLVVCWHIDGSLVSNGVFGLPERCGGLRMNARLVSKTFSAETFLHTLF